MKLCILTYTSVIYFFGITDLDIASCADDNTPYTFSSELGVILKKYLYDKNIGMVSKQSLKIKRWEIQFDNKLHLSSRISK